MSKKVFVGNLPWSHSSEDLESLFAGCGTIVSARVITDRETGRSRGFGFVEFESDDATQKAIQELDGHEISGRPIRVSEAQERAPRR